jgi:hypothetical protein
MDLVDLRLAATLLHAVPGATLSLHTSGGETLRAGCAPTADLSPCDLRQAIGAALQPCGACRPEASILDGVVGHDLTGPDLRAVGAGIVRVAVPGAVILVFATTLGPDTVLAALGAWAHPGLGVHVHHDEILRTTLVFCESHPADESLALDLLADAGGAVLVAGLETIR